MWLIVLCLVLAECGHAWKLLDKVPHGTDCFTEGLLYLDSTTLLESCGLYGSSAVLAHNLKSGESVKLADLPPKYFAEGISLYDNHLFVLTYKARKVLVYSLKDGPALELVGTVPYPDWEGWGMAFDGKKTFYVSDGSRAIAKLGADVLLDMAKKSVGDSLGEFPRPRHNIETSIENAEDLKRTYPYVVGFVKVENCNDMGERSFRLNELEYIEDEKRSEILANVYESGLVVRIDAETGKCTEWYDFAPLKEQQRGSVMNGIAQHPESPGQILLTGKMWPNMFRVELSPVSPPAAKTKSDTLEKAAAGAPAAAAPAAVAKKKDGHRHRQSEHSAGESNKDHGVSSGVKDDQTASAKKNVSSDLPPEPRAHSAAAHSVAVAPQAVHVAQAGPKAVVIANGAPGVGEEDQAFKDAVDQEVANIVNEAMTPISKWLTWLANALGVIYMFCWVASFYPQLIMNFRRKTATGFSFDFVVYNIIGYACYTAYCVVRYVVEKQYHLPMAVEIHDVCFSAHAFVLSLAFAVQICCYPRGSQKVGVTCWWLSAFVITVAGTNAALSFWHIIPWYVKHPIGWNLDVAIFAEAIGKITNGNDAVEAAHAARRSLDMVSVHWVNLETWSFIQCMAFIKLFINVIKYLPQVVLNCRRRSTEGLSTAGVLLDFIGSIFAFGQNGVDSLNYSTWKYLTGNIPKVLIAMLSAFFTLLILIQIFVIYRGRAAVELPYERVKDSPEFEGPPPFPHGTDAGRNAREIELGLGGGSARMSDDSEDGSSDGSDNFHGSEPRKGP